MVWLAHRRIPYDGQITAWLAKSVLGSLRGHRPTRHSPSHPASQTEWTRLKRLMHHCLGDISRLRLVTLCSHIPKLDSSVPYFSRSRNLATHPISLQRPSKLLRAKRLLI